ncbi:F-box/FBD/LRR-repeat protein At1g13570-like [Lycium ferocissimum]|uniref:F-box/FBD/LRR-repeat protein At1g13570-like n=1 Tax=Lycium ferocissimum TaxID=112874 RepID=UPI00281627D9|nr:F-box/FBD/LRR-repeat protein At1g13570-like [Lycium ferocissimum]
MPPKGRNCRRSLPPDFLSNLPDNVIDLILICLPCKDAVRTSILSRKWRYNWCRRTELMLDASPWISQMDPTIKFTNTINQIMTLHEGPVTKFTLDVGSLKSCPNIDNFINFLFRNGIQHLVLRLPSVQWGKIYKVPSSLFTCLQLRHLSLHHCLIHPPSVLQGFHKLISLELFEISISSELLGTLISLCPLLEQLALEILEILNIIEINAPMLRSFDFKGCISSICLKNVPCLAKISLIGEDSYEDMENFDLAEFFESCYALEHLLFDFFKSQLLDDALDEAPTRLPFDLNHVKHFHVPRIELVESYGLSCALCLIRSFPYLEYLEVGVYLEEDNGIVESLELEWFSNVTFNHLKEVKLERFTGTMPELQLIELFLAKSPVLVRVLIDTWLLDGEDPDIMLNASTELSNYYRASPKAELVYLK